jgi:hypothetical protein
MNITRRHLMAGSAGLAGAALAGQQAEYRADFDKIKTMDVDVSAGQIIYIPAYWWCSMQFPEKSTIFTTVCCFKYRTYMRLDRYWKEIDGLYDILNSYVLFSELKDEDIVMSDKDYITKNGIYLFIILIFVGHLS